MAVEKLITESAEVPTETDVPVYDQPDTEDSVPLSSLLGTGEPSEQQTGEETTSESNSEGDAHPQPEPQPQARTYTQEEFQAEFNKAFGRRADEIRQQARREIGREVSPDLELARLVKAAFPGMDSAAIENTLLQNQARELAEKTGWSLDEATSKIKARREFERGSPTTPTDIEQTPRFKLLDAQRAELNEREGIDILAIIAADPYLTEQVDTGRMDIKDAYMHYLKTNSTTTTKKPPAPPRIEKRGSAPSTPNVRKMSDAEVMRIDAQLKRGVKVFDD